MKHKNVILITAAASLLGCAQFIFAEPVVNISPRHGNLRDAQSLIVQAYERITNAQIDNRGGLGGHAAKAKELLSRADEELKLAAKDAR